MAMYTKLRKINKAVPPADPAFVAERLLALREQLKSEVVDKTGPGSFKIATWNLMHFCGGGAHTRTTESLLYIAEILDHFDFIAVQEVGPDTRQLKDLFDDYLGDQHWDYIMTDTSETDGGNNERIALLYRKDRVLFNHVAGEIVLPWEQSLAKHADLKDPKLINRHQFARSPFFAEFQAGWFKFKICSVHIHYGTNEGDNLKLRTTEIETLAQLLTKRCDGERANEVKELKARGWDTKPSAANYILLGDFNILGKDDETMLALTNNGFAVPEGIAGLSTNRGKESRPFDQIAFRLNDERFKQGHGGVFDFQKSVYRDEDFPHYKEIATERIKGKKATAESYYKRDYVKQQMSDHKLLWTSFEIDYADAYLKEFLPKTETAPAPKKSAKK